jgi:hypothetical protein
VNIADPEKDFLVCTDSYKEGLRGVPYAIRTSDFLQIQKIE